MPIIKTSGQKHPYTREAGWSLLHLDFLTEPELNHCIQRASLKFWKLWNTGFSGSHTAVLYKPDNSLVEWNEPSIPGVCRTRHDESVYRREIIGILHVNCGQCGVHLREVRAQNGECEDMTDDCPVIVYSNDPSVIGADAPPGCFIAI